MLCSGILRAANTALVLYKISYIAGNISVTHHQLQTLASVKAFEPARTKLSHTYSRLLEINVDVILYKSFV